MHHQATFHERYYPLVDYWEISLRIGNVLEGLLGACPAGSASACFGFQRIAFWLVEEIAEIIRRMVQGIPGFLGRIPGAISFRQFFESRAPEEPAGHAPSNLPKVDRPIRKEYSWCRGADCGSSFYGAPCEQKNAREGVNKVRACDSKSASGILTSAGKMKAPWSWPSRRSMGLEFFLCRQNPAQRQVALLRLMRKRECHYR